MRCRPGPARAAGALPGKGRHEKREPHGSRLVCLPPGSVAALARQRRLQGVVWVEVRLGVRGEQRERRLLRSSGVPMLDRAALEAVQTWHFNPDRVGGQAVPSRVQIPIEFNLLTAR